MWKFLKRYTREQAVNQKSSVDALQFLISGVSQDAVPTLADSVRQKTNIQPVVAAQIYAAVPYVNAAVRIQANSLAAVPIKTYMRANKSNNKKELFSGYPYKLLQYINPYMTQHEFVFSLVAWMALTGEAFAVVEDTPKKYANASRLSIYPLANEYVRKVPATEVRSRGIIYAVGGEEVFYPEGSFIHFKTFHPTDFWSGHCDLNALDTDLSIERYLKKKLSNSFANTSNVNAVLTVPGIQWGDEELQKYRNELDNKFTGVNAAYRTLVLAEGMQYDTVKNASLPMDFESVKVLESSIASQSMVLGVPPAILLGDGNAKDIAAIEALMWNKTIVPLAKLIGQTLTKALALPIDSKMSVEFDLKNVAALRLHELEKVRAQVAQVMVGTKTVNQIREDNDDEALDGLATDFGELPVPVMQHEWAKELSQLAASLKPTVGGSDASASMTLPGSQGGRDQRNTHGEAQLVDTSGKKSFEEFRLEFLAQFLDEAKDE